MIDHATPFAIATVPGNPYIQNSPAPPPANTLNFLGRKLETAAKKSETFAESVYNNATRFLIHGSSDTIFYREFGYVPGEKLKRALACYLSVTGGPVMGTLYISNRRVGFRSDSPVWSGPANGPGTWVYYKVIINVELIQGVNQSLNRANPGEKYIEIVTKDGHQFWFMGFMSYEKALKYLYEALPPAPLQNHHYYQQIV